MATFAYMGPRYTSWLKLAQVKPEWQGAIDRAARALLAGKERYQGIERQTGVPWAWIAVAHFRECNGNFKGVLHNGQLIVGTGRRTTIVPVGRGPFATWEESALDAIAMMGWGKLTWTIEMMCYKWEAFNGYGYAQMGRPSPYVWSGTNIYVQGKYVSDHNYDPNHVDQQVGCLPVYLRLIELAGETTVREQSTKLVLLDRVKTGAQTTIGTVATWFGSTQALDGQAYFNIGAALAIVGMAAIVWWLANRLDNMVMQDYNDGRYVPSGATIQPPVAPPAAPPKEPDMNWTIFLPLIQQFLNSIQSGVNQLPPQPTPVVPVQPPVIIPQPAETDGSMDAFLKNLLTAVLVAAAAVVIKELPQLIAKQRA